MDAVLRKTKLKKNVNFTFVTAFAAALLAIFLMPFLYMILTSLKTPNQMTIMGSPIYPAAFPTFTYEGDSTETYTVQVHRAGTLGDLEINMAEFVGETMDVYVVPFPDGTTRNLALMQGFQQEGIFIDPLDPEAGPIVWEGYYRSLDRPWEFSPSWSNYTRVWEDINYPRMLWNTSFYAFTTTIGILFSCILVAFGFSRFRFPGRDFLFIVLISTIFLPGAVTALPTLAGPGRSIT